VNSGWRFGPVFFLEFREIAHLNISKEGRKLKANYALLQFAFSLIFILAEASTGSARSGTASTSIGHPNTASSGVYPKEHTKMKALKLPGEQG
jgi:hypothetical protein